MRTIEEAELSARLDEVIDSIDVGETVAVARDGRVFMLLEPIEPGKPSAKA